MIILLDFWLKNHPLHEMLSAKSNLAYSQTNFYITCEIYSLKHLNLLA
jgi:hypothetical protein